MKQEPSNFVTGHIGTPQINEYIIIGKNAQACTFLHLP